MALFTLPRLCDPSGNEEPLQVEVVLSGNFLEIKVDGYGECNTDDGCPLFIEHYKGNLQVHVFKDINSESATTINMQGAQVSLRHVEP